MSQYAAVSGWVINNPNPLGMFFNQMGGCLPARPGGAG